MKFNYQDPKFTWQRNCKIIKKFVEHPPPKLKPKCDIAMDFVKISYIVKV